MLYAKTRINPENQGRCAWTFARHAKSDPRKGRSGKKWGNAGAIRPARTGGFRADGENAAAFRSQRGHARAETGKKWKSADKPGSVERHRRTGDMGSHSSATSPWRSAAYPGATRATPMLPIWPCPGWGLPCQSCCQSCGELYPCRCLRTDLSFARASRGTVSPLPVPLKSKLFKMDSVLRQRSPSHRRSALLLLSVASRRPAVSRHPALRGPDFPPRTTRCAATGRTSGRIIRVPAGRRPAYLAAGAGTKAGAPS